MNKTRVSDVGQARKAKGIHLVEREIMLIRHNHAFNTSAHHEGISPMSFDRHLVANLLVSVYSGVLKEPLPDRLERLVHELEIRQGSRVAEQPASAFRQHEHLG